MQRHSIGVNRLALHGPHQSEGPSPTGPDLRTKQRFPGVVALHRAGLPFQRPRAVAHIQFLPLVALNESVRDSAGPEAAEPSAGPELPVPRLALQFIPDKCQRLRALQQTGLLLVTPFAFIQTQSSVGVRPAGVAGDGGIPVHWGFCHVAYGLASGLPRLRGSSSKTLTSNVASITRLRPVAHNVVRGWICTLQLLATWHRLHVRAVDAQELMKTGFTVPGRAVRDTLIEMPTTRDAELVNHLVTAVPMVHDI
mmetsp:Transcript_92313/g.211310  ORF Transcript_92313/g.211310 Transcript_92313/m.211310 type:complete len:253 (-) Transcript_92313:2440-3198(-)